jgi:hypothetical protein
MKIYFVKVGFFAGLIFLTPFLSYADETCYEQILNEKKMQELELEWDDIIPIWSGIKAANRLYTIFTIELESPEDKQKLAECLRKYDPNINSENTVLLVEKILEEGKKNEVKKMEITLGSDDYKSIEGSIGYKFIGASVGYERQNGNTFIMKIEYK